jgi:hypothetical protein
MLFLQSPKLGLPQPLTLTLAREGLGESQFRRVDIHCGLFIYTYFVCCILRMLLTSVSKYLRDC